MVNPPRRNPTRSRKKMDLSYSRPGLKLSPPLSPRRAVKRRSASPLVSPYLSRIIAGAFLCAVIFAGLRTITHRRVSVSAVEGASTTHRAPLSVDGLESSFKETAKTYDDIDFGIVVQDLTSDNRAVLNPDLPFVAASTSKLVTAATFLTHVQDGSASLTQKVGDFEAEFQLQQMINQSNNDSWNLFNALYDARAQNAYAKSIGMIDTAIDKNQLTAADLSLLLKKLYAKQLLNEALTDKLLGYMQQTNDETLIPSVLPGGATVYHKYGALGEYVHDAAIIDYKGRLFSLVIMTKSSIPDYQTRTSIFQTITRDVLDRIK